MLMLPHPTSVWMVPPDVTLEEPFVWTSLVISPPAITVVTPSLTAASPAVPSTTNSPEVLAADGSKVRRCSVPEIPMVKVTKGACRPP